MQLLILLRRMPWPLPERRTQQAKDSTAAKEIYSKNKVTKCDWQSSRKYYCSAISGISTYLFHPSDLCNIIHLFMPWPHECSNFLKEDINQHLIAIISRIKESIMNTDIIEHKIPGKSFSFKEINSVNLLVFYERI